MNGIYVTIDGPNFVGKSTLINAVISELDILSVKVSKIKGVSKSLIGQFIDVNIDIINKNPRALALIIAADKYFSYEKYVENPVSNKTCVISDRYLASCLAYQYLDNMPFEYTWQIYKDLPFANINFFLTASPKELEKRMHNRKEPLSNTEMKFSREEELFAFYNAVNFMKSKNINVITIDNENSTIKENTDKIVSIILTYLKT